jgi:hypothetical protein
MVLSVVLAAAHLQSAWAQTSSSPDWAVQLTKANTPSSSDTTCIVYSLSSMGAEAGYVKWIAESIPEVVEPATWSQAGGVGRIRYFAPSQVLVVHHTAAVHAKVDSFLKDLRKATPPAKLALPATYGEVLTEMPRVVQAQYTEPPVSRPAAAAGATYLVPPPLSQPKHLFHLIVRYEGDGTNDGSVSGLLKDLTASSVAKDDGGDKANPAPAKSTSLKEMLHVIVRYEGDGIVDANVVALLKEYFNASAGKAAAPVLSQSYNATPPGQPGQPVPPPPPSDALPPAPQLPAPPLTPPAQPPMDR